MSMPDRRSETISSASNLLLPAKQRIPRAVPRFGMTMFEKVFILLRWRWMHCRS
jgi:hypothetical protein